MTLQKRVQEILRQLEQHSPSWIMTVRSYIEQLERRDDPPAKRRAVANRADAVPPYRHQVARRADT